MTTNNIDAKYKSIIQIQHLEGTYSSTNDDYDVLDQLLEREKQHSSTKTWNKLDNSQKLQKLHAYAEKYGKERNLPMKEIKNLKTFLSQQLHEHKLQKTKEVLYNKDTREIININVLHFSDETQCFYLKDLDGKQSTMKSLTPKRMSEKNRNVAPVPTSTEVEAGMSI